MLDPQTENVFVLISSVGLQRRDAFIRVQKGPRTTRKTDIKSQKSHGQLDEHTDGNIILPLRGFEPMACGLILCAQLWAAQMNFYCQFKAVFWKKTLI